MIRHRLIAAVLVGTALTTVVATPAEAFTRTSCIALRTVRVGPVRYGQPRQVQSYCYIGNVTPWDYFFLGVRQGYQWVNGNY